MIEYEETNQARPNLPNSATSRYSIARLVLADIDRGGVMKERFTKGEWVASDDAVFTVDSEMPDIVADYICDMAGIDSIQKISDAHLISAAPDMFDVLDNLENDNGAIPDWLWKARNKALAKARGEV